MIEDLFTFLLMAGLAVLAEGCLSKNVGSELFLYDHLFNFVVRARLRVLFHGLYSLMLHHLFVSQQLVRSNVFQVNLSDLQKDVGNEVFLYDQMFNCVVRTFGG